VTAHANPVLAVAARAARRAATVIGDAARDLKRLPTFSKEHADIVAAADREAGQAIVATIAAAFPDHAILAEEAGASTGHNAESPYRWIVDPIDGTLNFAHGYPYYAVSIALVHGGDVTHAVVLDPTRDELFTAVRGRGAQIGDAPLRTSGCTRLGGALVGAVVPTRRSPRLPRFLPIFDALSARCTLRRSGACALDLAYVAAGRLDGFLSMSFRAWDIAAGTLLVTEAGGRIGDFAGGPEVMRSQELIAAAPGVFSPLREAVGAADPR